MGKEADRLKFHSDNSFGYRYDDGKVGDLRKRYGVAGTTSVKADQVHSKGPSRTRADVDRDLASAMTKDYDTRRMMEAAALAGNKDAQKYAKEGYNSENVFAANDTISNLEKEYGEDYGAGLTLALVNADRNALTKKFSATSADDQQKAAQGTTPKNVAPSDEVLAAKERAAAWQSSNGMSEPSPYAERSAKFF